MLRSFPALILTAFLAADVSHAQPQKLQIDLAAIAPGSELTFSVPPGDYSVEIINKVQNKSYNIQATVSFITPPPLPVPGESIAKFAIEPCKELYDSKAAIERAKDENEVAAAVAQTQELLNAGSCTSQPVVSAAKTAIQNTLYSVPATFSLASGQELVVSVSRPEGTDQKRWKATYQTPARGRWFSSYGFAFVRNNDEQYFSKPKEGETGKFLITRKADNKDYDFAPSLFYSWMPASREGRNVNPGVAAGLGFDQSNPIVFVGPMLTYNQNISLVAGVVVHKQKRLTGTHSVGQEITTSLTEDQLKEETFKPSFFFGVSFRFGSNPFASGQDSAKKAADVKPAPNK